MARAASESELDRLLAAAAERGVELEDEQSPKARTIGFKTGLTYTLEGDNPLAFRLGGDVTLVFNADGSLRSATFKLKPRED